ncbi:helix-turn-helix transcriptional regulator [Larkinella arboricola]|uniref:Putative DNA-binding transcriptional regulator YafY n=1 Tax=Larkinella arboricola TaxID=643671 RepID=A0A327X8Z5_LARAB|nr:WYL domain-containing protein [Larkinella arboricola]RAK02728.1 putative DNA-binding transcriptional regulator YafY [Larkinella arboricola]
MPITRSAFQRYRLIDEVISRHPRRYSKQRLFELLREHCGIRSISSLEKDIQRLREDHDAPIAYDKRANGYYYTDPQFRLLRLMLTPDDMEALDYAREVLAATQGAPVVAELTNALQKVRQSLDIVREVRHEDGNTLAPGRKVVYVEEKILGGNRQYVPVLIRAVNQNRQVSFHYHKHDGAVNETVASAERTRKLHPILLREVSDSWYVIGYDEASGREKTYALDRMSDLEILDEPCAVPDSVLAYVSEFFEHIYGITDTSDPVEDIILSFTPLFGRYVKAKPIHQTQVVLRDDDTECVVKLRLAPNRDLMMHLRSYGEHLKVVQPESLVKAMKESLRAMLERYQG